MKELAFLIVMALIGGLFVVIGYKIGTEIGKRVYKNSVYWICNIVVFVLGVLLSAISIATSIPATTVAAIGVIAGLIAGLKHGFGTPVGIWKKHDEFFKLSNEDAEAQKEQNKRELMSVQSKDADKYKK